MTTFPLIRRKLKAPAVPDTFVRRPGLVERLQEGRDPRKKVTFVCAGPGYGKSTTVSDYVRQSGLRHCWINLEPFDADLTSFLHYLIGGVTSAWPEDTSQARELLSATANPEPILPNLMGLFAEEVGDRGDEPFILVLDDFHAVQDSEPVVKALEAFIGYQPENVQLVLISRTQVPLRLPQMKVRQQLVELGIPELRFNPPEVGALIRSVSGRELAPSEAEALFASTEGWAASLILAAQQAGELPLPGDGAALFDYLAQEVFSDLPPERQDFLVRTALLPSVDPEVCETVLGLAQSEPTIQALRRANLLLSRGESSDGYYHPIFQAFLQAKLQERLSHEEERALRVRIGTYLHAEHPEDALSVYLDGKLYAEAAEVVAELAPAYIAQFRLEALDRLLKRFPAELGDASPWLLLHGGDVLRLWGQSDAALTRFERAEGLAHEAGDPAAEGRALAYQAAVWGSRGDARLKELSERAIAVLPDSDLAGRAFAWNALGMFHQMSNDVRAALEAFEQALDLHRQAADPIGQSKILHNLGLTYTRQGDFARASATYRESIRQAEMAGRRAYPATYNNLAAIHHSLGEFQEAWSAAEQGLTLAQQLGARRDELWTILTLGMIASALGQHAKADDLFQRSREGAVSMGDRPLEAQALSGLSELARHQGRLDRALELLNQAIALRGMPIEASGMVDFQIPLGQLALERKEWDRALEMLALAHATLEAQGLRYRLAQVLFYEARALQGKGDPLAAARSQEARAICEANGYAYLMAQEPTVASEGPDQAAPEVQKVVPAAPSLRICCFGTFEASTEGGTIATKQWQGTKTKLVLAYLLHHRQGVTREQLAQLLYGDEDVSRSAILMIISRLRQALEPDLAKNAPSRFIQWRDGRYFFNFGAPYELDVQEFEFHLEQSKAGGLSEEQAIKELARALLLYRGRYLKDMDESLWVQSVQEHFHQRALDAFQRVIVHHADRTDHQAVMEWADRTLAVDSCAEFAHQAKMLALHQLGNRQGAIRHFQQLEEVLQQELGVDPAPESRRLYEQILSGKM